jgi:methylase of polypeptide subunit release factors
MTNVVPFGSLVIETDDRVLSPRPWTTEQARWAAQQLDDAPSGPVLELCCGAGQIGLLAIAGNSRRLVAVDASAIACELTRRNAMVSGLSGRTQVREGSVGDAVRPGERFALVIADPPWVPSDETARYPGDPIHAIDGGEDGLEVARECVRVAEAHLLECGSLVLQLGSRTQALVLGEHLVTNGSPLDVRDVRVIDGSGVLMLLVRAVPTIV